MTENKVNEEKKTFEIDFKKFFADILIPITPPEIVKDCINVLMPGDAQASALEEIIEKEAENIRVEMEERRLMEESVGTSPKKPKKQTFKSLFIMMVNSMGLVNEVTNITHAIGLIGFVQVRNAIMGLSLYQHFNPNENIKFDKIAGGEIEKQIRFALDTEKFALANKCHSSDIAFIPGLIFDILAQLITVKKEQFEKIDGPLSKIDNVINEIFRHSLQVAFVADYLERKSKAKILLGRHAFNAGFLHDIGKLALIAYSPKAYSSILHKRAETFKPFSELEESLFDFPHETISSLILKKLDIFTNIEIPIDHHHDHDILAIRNPDMHRLAALIEISDAIVHKTIPFLGDTHETDIENMKARIIIKLEKHFIKEAEEAINKLSY